MKRHFLPAQGFGLLLCLGACGTSGDRGGEASRSGPRPEEPAASPVQTATPVGLYESRSGSGTSQLCVVPSSLGQYRFGLVLRTADGRSCSGAGRATPRANRISLEMAGDRACRIEAAADGLKLSFPSLVPPGCAYYCASGATLANALLEKKGGAAGDAEKARDLVGDLLCAVTPPS